jgi:CRP/FNR family cyclic AMP-dependent transcriptional regulator
MDRTTLLQHTGLFDDLSADELGALAGRLEERRVDAGVDVFVVGDPGDSLFVVADGAVDIQIDAAKGDAKGRTTVASLFPGQVFGEMSLFDGSSRSATATATKASLLLVLDQEDFRAFVSSRPAAALKIMGELAQRIRATNDLFASQVSRDVLEEADENLTLGQRVADTVAAFGGSWTFIFVFVLAMSVWMGANLLLGDKEAFDPYPFILLNLMLSTTAALQAPVIMMSQNRQATKDKLLAQNDYLVNLKAEVGIQNVLKNQAEVLQRLALLERGLAAPGKAPARPDGGA